MCARIITIARASRLVSPTSLLLFASETNSTSNIKPFAISESH